MAKWSKKTYELIAKHISSEASEFKKREKADSQELENLTRRFTEEFACDNPEFQRDRFVKACGYAAH